MRVLCVDLGGTCGGKVCCRRTGVDDGKAGGLRLGEASSDSQANASVYGSALALFRGIVFLVWGTVDFDTYLLPPVTRQTLPAREKS